MTLKNFLKMHDGGGACVSIHQEPYNYEKMLYKLIAQGLIQSDSKYI